MEFKTKLIRSIEHFGGYGSAVRRDEYKKMIRYGALGELGENYYLFIYRDLFRSSGYYGAVIFINKPGELGTPVQVHCIEQDGVEQTRNVYIRAALYFLENECDNTMDVAGTITDVFNLAKEKIEAHAGRPTTAAKELETFSFDVTGQEIAYQEIEPRKLTRKPENRALKKQITLLRQRPDSGHTDELKPHARLGLSLKVDYIGMTEGKKIAFQPLAVPVKADGEPGTPRKILPTDVKKYQFLDLPPSLENFLDHFSALDHQLFSDSLKIKIVNQLYFTRLITAMFELPEGLKFCTPENVSKSFRPLKTVTFAAVHVRFAPSLKKDTVFNLRLMLTEAGSGERLDTGVETVIQVNGGGIYLFFTTPGGEHCLAVPGDIQPFYPFFKFLEAGQEFQLFDFDDVYGALKDMESDTLVVDDHLLKKYHLTLKPSPVLNVLPADLARDQKERVEIRFDYEGEIRKFLKDHPDKAIHTYDPDAGFEAMCLQLLRLDTLLKQEMTFDNRRRGMSYFFTFMEGDFLDWIVEKGRFYLEKGFRIYIAKWKQFIDSAGSRIHVSLHSNTDWLEFDPTVHDPVTGRGLAIDTIDFESKVVTDKKGKLHLLTKEELDKLRDIYKYGERHGNLFRVPSRNHILINRLYDQKMDDIPELRETLKAGKKLKQFERIEDRAVSSTFNGTLRGYQQEGFKWLNFLQEYGFSGCLADDMGLGKTVQTLALLQSLKTENRLKTSLLVLPVSAIPNWESEIEKFTGLTYHRHIGVKRDKDSQAWADTDLVLTSYATLRNDIEIFSEFTFDYIILDESQNIKNHASQVSKAAKVLNASHRLALSGTPIENTSLELWSLFDFLMPGYLGTVTWFSRQFAAAIEKEKDEMQADLLRRMIYPFIMRRKKEEVEAELPEKTEIVTRLRMEEEQAQLYQETSRYYRDILEEEIDEQGVGKSSIKILEGMLRLRQLCLFPRLVNPKFKEIPSAKFDHLTNLMEDILSENHKVLVFSQFVEALKILRGHFDGAGVEYSYLDGSVPLKKREEAIKAFQEEADRRVFLLSLKAGGVAINLTAADYVIIFDPWWNPAVEAQAIDRSHRIGQTRKVLVYRMVVEGSIEEKMLQLQEDKKNLVENLITSDSKSFKNLKKDDILKLFS